MLQGVARGCQVQDRAFWPQRLSCAVLPVSTAVTEPKKASTAPEEDEALGMLGILDRYALLFGEGIGYERDREEQRGKKRMRTRLCSKIS